MQQTFQVKCCNVFTAMPVSANGFGISPGFTMFPNKPLV